MAMRRPAEAFPPGEFIKEELEERGWSQAVLADIMGRPAATINEIVTGKRGISPETALGLGAAFGTSAEYWMNLHAAFQLWRVGADESNLIERRSRLYGIGPVNDLVKRGWIEPSDDIAVFEGRVLRFYGMDGFDDEPELPSFAAKKSTSYDQPLTPTQVAWLRRALQLAQAVDAADYDPAGLDDVVAQLRLLMHHPQEIRHVPKILSNAGIRMVVVQPLAGSKIDGACFWVEGQPVIVLSLRFDRIDNFWFVLCHELGHVQRGKGSIDTDLDGDADSADIPKEERMANEFAAEHIIPPHRLNDFIARVRPLYSARRIEAFALTMNVHPGIVVGQLQHRGEIQYAAFRKLLAPIRDIVASAALTDGWGTALPSDL